MMVPSQPIMTFHEEIVEEASDDEAPLPIMTPPSLMNPQSILTIWEGIV